MIGARETVYTLFIERYQNEQEFLGNLDKVKDELNTDAMVQAESEISSSYTNAEKIIDEYRNHEYAMSDSDIDSMAGKTYKPSEYLTAMTDYSYWTLVGVFQGYIDDLIDELKQILEYIDEITDNIIGSDDIKVSFKDPYGWAVHDLEDSLELNNDTKLKHLFNKQDYTCNISFWINKQLDGLNGITIDLPNKIGCLYFSWDPEKSIIAIEQ